MSTTWRELIAEEMEAWDESWENVVSCTLSDDGLDISFDNGYGIHEGKPFTLWTAERVYFPVEYDGAEWVASVSRNPDGIPTRHM